MADLVKTTETSGLIPFKEVEDKIVVIRGQEVLLDRDVAELYGVETKRINEAIRNNSQKFRGGVHVRIFFREKHSSKVENFDLRTIEDKELLSNY